MSFEDWMSEVDFVFARELGGLTSEDLPDVDYMSYWEADSDPEETALDLLEEMEDLLQ